MEPKSRNLSMIRCGKRNRPSYRYIFHRISVKIHRRCKERKSAGLEEASQKCLEDPSDPRRILSLFKFQRIIWTGIVLCALEGLKILDRNIMHRSYPQSYRRHFPHIKVPTLKISETAGMIIRSARTPCRLIFLYNSIDK